MNPIVPPTLALRSRHVMGGWLVAALLLSALPWMSATATAATGLEPHLEPLRPLLDKTWKGAFSNSNPDRPIVDVMRWERALNGRAVRVLHSINEGSYGGETIYMWSEDQKALTYHYFTTAGFMTTGTLRVEDGHFHTHEIVKDNPGGVTEVKAVSHLAPDGSFVVRTEHLKEGKWEPGRETVYREDATARVVFR